MSKSDRRESGVKVKERRAGGTGGYAGGVLKKAVVRSDFVLIRRFQRANKNTRQIYPLVIFNRNIGRINNVPNNNYQLF